MDVETLPEDPPTQTSTRRADGKVWVAAPYGAEAYVPRYDGMDGWGPEWILSSEADEGGLSLDEYEPDSDIRLAAVEVESDPASGDLGVWLDPADAVSASVLRRVVGATAKVDALIEAFDFMLAVAAPVVINGPLRRFSRHSDHVTSKPADFTPSCERTRDAVLTTCEWMEQYGESEKGRAIHDAVTRLEVDGLEAVRRVCTYLNDWVETEHEAGEAVLTSAWLDELVRDHSWTDPLLVGGICRDLTLRLPNVDRTP